MLRFLRWIATKAGSKKKAITVESVPFKPVAVLDVSAAPDVCLRSHQGEVLYTCNLHQEPFKQTLERWSEVYSIAYPTAGAWECFYSKYKSVI